MANKVNEIDKIPTLNIRYITLTNLSISNSIPFNNFSLVKNSKFLGSKVQWKYFKIR